MNQLKDIEQQKRHVGHLFDRIAHSYDGLNHLLSMGIDRCWRRQAVQSMKPVDKVLDIAVGTGDLALLLLRRGKANQVIGIDLSTEMMRIGAQKAKRRGVETRLHFQEANAQNMPFPDEHFDAVTCAYGVRNFADLDAGLREMYRVLKQGGELTILEFGYPQNKLIRWIYDRYFTTFLPLIGRLFSRDRTAYTYLNQSVKHFCYGDDFVAHLQKVGFSGTCFRRQTFGISYLYKARKL
ncbi:MAG: bifunctional demethylmenaquinone methyltransferase/2-methoxy-6-polyprenyl-1,4-benzoquinol methylase UbiE [Paludibacteraceae bacterium]|nr:bifunctional demethylmenaquinone methyltransferase/2-methoxy-6-polyprenyl-1,4-benzoquinol methylase UbiE [Paludibacteraceae bacterium]